MAVAPPPIKGQPVSPADVQFLEKLQASFDPQASLDRLSSFAQWIFASSSIVGTSAVGFTIVDASSLSTTGRWLVGIATATLALSLAVAAWSQSPKSLLVNPNSRDSMLRELEGVIRRRRRRVRVAALLFGSALLLTGLGPLVSQATEPETEAVDYSFTGTKIFATLDVDGAEPGSPLTLAFATRSAHGSRSLPRARGHADSGGNGKLTTTLGSVEGRKAVSIVATWQASGETKRTVKVIRVVLPKPSKPAGTRRKP